MYYITLTHKLENFSTRNRVHDQGTGQIFDAAIFFVGRTSKNEISEKMKFRTARSFFVVWYLIGGEFK